MGPERISIATRALDDIDTVYKTVDASSERIVVYLDVCGGSLATHGGSDKGGNVWVALRVLNGAGVAHPVVTDVTHDDQMNGSNQELLTRVTDQTPACTITSSRISSLADIEALRALDIKSAIVGKALYQGALTLADALGIAGYEELS